MSEWIKAKIEPEETGDYLCALQSIAGTVSYEVLAWAPWDGCKGWYKQDGKGNPKPYKGLQVTHWMPIPDAPEEKKEMTNDTPHWTTKDKEDALAVRRLFPDVETVHRGGFNCSGLYIHDSCHYHLDESCFPSLADGESAYIDDILKCKCE